MWFNIKQLNISFADIYFTILIVSAGFLLFLVGKDQNNFDFEQQVS